MQTFAFEPIGFIRSCFKEKFGIPRQPGIIPQACAVLEMLPSFGQMEAFRGLEEFSHIWILFVFHACRSDRGRLTVRPPRLGGNHRVGVFASRSGFRPNPIGQSVVELHGIAARNATVELHLSGVDLLDGTPVLDIKPYLPYAECLPNARAGYADGPPTALMEVVFSDAAAAACRQLEDDQRPGLGRLIQQILAFDPRPAYKNSHPGRDSSYGMRLWDLNIRFTMAGCRAVVQTVEPFAGCNQSGK